MKASGKTMTVGELRKAIAGMADDDHVWIEAAGEVQALDRVDGEILKVVDSDTDSAQSAYDALDELRDFSGTKAAMIKIIARYWGDDE